MKRHDVVFYHPPKLFRDELAQGPIAPMGLFSLASILEREGYDTKIVNLGMMPASEMEKHVRSTESDIYAIDLQWAAHTNGGVRLAELCKKHHPDSYVVLGGFTATRFAEEILRNHPWVDAVIMGEGEHTLLEFVQAVRHGSDYSETRSLAYRVGNRPKINTAREPPPTLDSFDFTQLDLLENWQRYVKTDWSGYQENLPPYLWLEIGRGCEYGCIYCGGCRTSYQSMTGRRSPISRSPLKVADDIVRLQEYGVRNVSLSHDPEIFGIKYWSKLLEEVKKSGVDISIYWECFRLPSREFLQEISKVSHSLRVSISPESPSEEVRVAANRPIKDDDLFRVVDLCEEMGFAVDVYFFVGLPGETAEFYDKFVKMTKKLSTGLLAGVVPPTLYSLDPGCPMATDPDRYGIKVYFKRFEDYRRICENPNDLDWIGYETSTLSRQRMVELRERARSYLKTLQPPLLRPGWRYT